MRDWHLNQQRQERERLQHVSTRQRERLASETSREREVLEREENSLFEQQAVRAKMQTLCAQLATLDALRCSTSAESFPGLQLRPPSTECVRCSRDNQNCTAFSTTTWILAPCHLNFRYNYTYRLDAEAKGSTRFRIPTALSCSVPSAVRTLLY